MDNEPAATTREAPNDSPITGIPTPVDIALAEGVEPERIREAEPVRFAVSASDGSGLRDDG